MLGMFTSIVAAMAGLFVAVTVGVLLPSSSDPRRYPQTTCELAPEVGLERTTPEFPNELR
jgi:hypothetical protein